MEAPARGVYRLVLAFMPLALLANGCALRGTPTSIQDPPAFMDGVAQKFVSGVWQGTSVSDCLGMTPCRGLKHITFTMLPITAGSLSGFYRCEQITGACDIFDDRGVITSVSVESRLLSVHVELRDDQSCVFRSAAAPVEMEGRFLCKQRAIVVDRGVWRAARSF